MTSPSFGLDVLSSSDPTQLDRLWAEAEIADIMTRQILLMETYETTYGICDHDGEAYDQPLALVTMHPKEDTATYSRLYGELMRFAKEDLFRELWGLSILDMLQMPKDVVDEMYRITREIMEEKTEEGESMSRKLMRESARGGRMP